MAQNHKTEPFVLSNRQIDADDYIKIHKINELFANITSHLVFTRPGNKKLVENLTSKCSIYLQMTILLFEDDPKKSIIEYLESLKKSRTANLPPPTLFEDANLHSMYGILDPSGKGSITYNQYCECK